MSATATHGQARGPDESPFGRVLVVAAHPDDPEFLFGATVAMLTSGGAVCGYVICSDGANGSRDPARPREELAAVRSGEQRRAAACLGVEQVVFLDFPDGRLAPSAEMRTAIAREIRRFRPELIITHYPRRVLHIPIEASHPDHTAVGEATLAAVFPDASNARVVPELLAEGLAPHRAREVWLAGYEDADHFVDATELMDRKIEAICCHRSQVEGPDPRESLAWVYGWMSHAGRVPGFEYAETYRRIKL